MTWKFDISLYGKAQDQLTPEERLSLGVAHIVNTSIYDARTSIASASKEVLEKALEVCKGRTGNKTLIKIIEARIRRIERNQKEQGEKQ